jgi:hypothetical protein
VLSIPLAIVYATSTPHTSISTECLCCSTAGPTTRWLQQGHFAKPLYCSMGVSKHAKAIRRTAAMLP